MAQWERALAALPAEQGSQDQVKRSEIWESIDADNPEDLEVNELEHGLRLHLDVDDLFDIGDAVKRAYTYAREVNSDGPEDKLLFSEFRTLLFYLKRLVAVLQFFSKNDVFEDQDLQQSHAKAIEAALENLGIILPDISDLWNELRVGLSSEPLDVDDSNLDFNEEREVVVPFHRFTDWAVRQAFKLFEIDPVVEKITAFEFRASARVAKSHHPKLWDRQQGVEAIWECIAADEVDIKLLREILSQGRPDVNYKDKNFSWTPVHFAANLGRVDLIGALLQKKADIQAKCRVGNIALHIASRKGHENAVKFLCAKSKLGGIQAQNTDGLAPLTCAAMNGHDDVVRLLISSEAEINLADAEGRTPAMWAVRHGHLSLLNIFLESGCNLVAEDKYGATVMDHAVDHLDMQTLLIEHENLNNKLLDATQRSCVTEVTQILDMKGYVDAKDSVGFTPLSWAMLNNATDLVKLLAQRNANPQVTDFSAIDLGEDNEAIKSALDYGMNTAKRLLQAAKRDNWEQVHVEVAAGANVNQKDEGTLITVLMCAAIYGRSDQVAMLLDKKAIVNQKDGVGWTVSHYAAFAGNCQMASLLTHRKADFGIKSHEQQTMLHLAARADYGAMVQLLIVAHCKMESKDSSHHVPLQIAAEWGSAEALCALLACDADPTVKDAEGRTIMMTACIHGYVSIVRMLFNPEPSLPEIPIPKAMAAVTKDKLEESPFMLIARAVKEREKRLTKKFKFDKIPWLLEQDCLGNYPIGIAIMSGNDHMVPTLLDKKTQVDVVDYAGNTPLMLAAARGYQQVVDELLSKKARVKLRNKEGKSAADLAKTEGIRQLLQKRIIEKSLPKQDPQAVTPEGEEVASETVYRVRIEGLPKILLPDVLREQVSALLRRLSIAAPVDMDIVVDPIHERPMGYAYLDFDQEDVADALASKRSSNIAGVLVRLIDEGPRSRPSENVDDLGDEILKG